METGILENRAAIREALQNCDKWIGGAVIVKSGDTYTAWPGANMTDISFTVDGEVVYQIDHLADVTGMPTSWYDMTPDEQSWAVDQIAVELV